MEKASTSTENEQKDATTTEDQMEYDAGCPFILEVKYDDGTQKEYKLMTIDEAAAATLMLPPFPNMETAE